jgi:hypothetical protein
MLVKLTVIAAAAPWPTGGKMHRIDAMKWHHRLRAAIDREMIVDFAQSAYIVHMQQQPSEQHMWRYEERSHRRQME